MNPTSASLLGASGFHYTTPDPPTPKGEPRKIEASQEPSTQAHEGPQLPGSHSPIVQIIQREARQFRELVEAAHKPAEPPAEPPPEDPPSEHVDRYA